MRAVVFAGAGGIEAITVAEVAPPVPSVDEVLVRVAGAGLNRADLLQRRGLYPAPPNIRADIPGLELAGTVLSVGARVRAWKPGDRVMAIAGGEAQAELAVVHERMLVRVPDGIELVDAGGIPEAFITAHDALFTIGGLRPGWTVLLHAAGSGVSTVAAQLARAAGATVVGTSRTPGKLERATDVHGGLHHGLLVSGPEPRFSDELRRRTGGGAHLILDFVGAPYAAENLASLVDGGTLVLLGAMGGGVGPIDLTHILRRRLRVVGTALRSRPLDDKIRATQDFARDVLPLLASGRVRPVIDARIALDDARAAHVRMEANDSFGKLVLVP